MASSPTTLDPVPSVAALGAIVVSVAATATDDAIIGVFAAPGAGHGDFDADALRAAGFDGKVGQTLVIPRAGQRAEVLIGSGEPDGFAGDGARDAAAAFAVAAPDGTHLALDVRSLADSSPDWQAIAQCVVEGVLLASYRFDVLRTTPKGRALERVTLVVTDESAEATAAGATRGVVTSRATMIARDLANAPPALLTATRMAELATEIGAAHGLGVEVFDEEALLEMGCGGLLGVNAGSHQPPRMIRLTYAPPAGDGTAPPGHLTLVGKGIMYDAGGIALKPADGVHATMKNDMSGAGAVLAAMASLADVGCTTAVTGYLMCTDNMPSGTAIAMGEVLTIRGGTTVEVVNTDAEGRLVMADALVLATESPTDAIVDIATLTGACMRALGTRVAGVIGNDESIVAQVRDAGGATDEPVWELPLEHRYRPELDTPIADLKNLGGANAGAITAALFLNEFVGDHPWAHIDIAGTAQNDSADSWRPAGCTGFGARLLIELAVGFVPPAP